MKSTIFKFKVQIARKLDFNQNNLQNILLLIFMISVCQRFSPATVYGSRTNVICIGDLTVEISEIKRRKGKSMT